MAPLRGGGGEDRARGHVRRARPHSGPGRPPVRRLFRLGIGRPRPRDAVDWEIEHHLAEQTDRLVAEGWAPDEAAREARRRFGRMRAYRKRLERIERRRAWMRRGAEWTVAAGESLVASLRSLLRQPALSAGIVLTLGVGIGANAAMFTILDRLFFEPPTHVRDADAVRAVLIERSSLGRTFASRSMAHPDVTDLEAHSALTAYAAYSPAERTLGAGDDASKVRVVTASYTLFPLLGVTPQLGRFYGREDDRLGAPPVAVVSHEYWTRALGGTPDALGRELRLGGTMFTVVGVAPRGFTGAELAAVDVWLPLLTGGMGGREGDEWVDNRGWFWLRAVVRLGDGVNVAAAEEEATRLHRSGRQEDIARGGYDAGARVRLDPLVTARGPEASAESKVALWLGGVSLLLLVIVCANVANLLLARGMRRQREDAVKLALGVSRSRLVAHTMLETVLLGLAGSALALGIAYWGGAVVQRVLLPGIFFPDPLGFRLAAFTVGLAVFAGVLAGLAPALRATRLDLARDLAEGARGSARRSRLRDLLTVAQAALSVVLLVGAGLFVRSLEQVRSLDLGLDVDRIALATLEFEDDLASGLTSYGRQATEAQEFNALYARALERVRRVPGVELAAGTASPFGWSFATGLSVPGWDSLPDLPGGGPYFHVVTPGYFETAGLQVTAGRPMQESDGPADAPVAWVSKTMAETLWPTESPLGRCLIVDEDDACTTVAGVVEDASRGSLEEERHMAFYLPVAQRQSRRLNGLYIRAADDARAVAASVAATLRGFDPRVRFVEVETLREALDPQTRSWKLGASLFTLFGFLALLVAGIGLYGLLAFHVAQRRRELGIRSALGAAGARLLGAVVGEGARLTLGGVALGLVLVLALGRFAEPLLFRVSPRDPLVLALVAAALVGTGLVASLLPGMRATRADPMDALRAE